MASLSWAEKVLLGKKDRTPRGLVEDCFEICISMPGGLRTLWNLEDGNAASRDGFSPLV